MGTATKPLSTPGQRQASIAKNWQTILLLEVEVKFGDKELTLSLLILPEVVEPLVLGWNYLTQVGTEVMCAGHEILIPGKNRHNKWLEDKLSVAVDQHYVGNVEHSRAPDQNKG